MLDRRLDYFLAVAETGSMLAASKGLYMAQPTLSQHMSSLEKDLDVTLFERGPRGVKLTPAGDLLYREALRLKDQTGAVLERMRDLDRHVEAVLRLGGGMNQRDLFLPEVVQAFTKAYPDVELSFLTLPALELPRAVAEGRVDVATFWSSPVARELKCQWDVVKSYDVGICMPSHHPLAEKKIIYLEDLEGETLMTNPYGHFDATDAIRNAIAASSADINLVDANDDEAMEHYAIGGALSITPYPYPYERSHIQIVKLSIDCTIPAGFITAQERGLLAERFVELAKAVACDLP
ncbi:LysR family transcriptional regulator [Adlercreutzia equolifaciens]|uniref:LysR family transcriptional regulator n=1 Tax=Adlercreutzia equolifaciens TaxID=446660 RepID=UPI0023B16CA1|nr:LysR family transcriptional regulator [Adlercreutzia equolifaciens]MDE8703417.1 LysR family transcriptional regulator [Adlercreutzia equolifaciens]